jgi:hypothetical protein
MVKYIFYFKKKKYILEVKELKGIFEMAQGLMFNKKPEILLFSFNKCSRTAIHSFFCKKFVAIWIKDKKVVEIKKIDRWRPYIVPKSCFDELIEIPSNNKNYKIFADEDAKV